MANPFAYAGCAYGQPQFGTTAPEVVMSSGTPGIVVFQEVRTLHACDPRLLAAFAEQRISTASSSPLFPAPTDIKVFS